MRLSGQHEANAWNLASAADACPHTSSCRCTFTCVSATTFCCPASPQEPAVRLTTLEAAGQEAVPFTTGILIGRGCA